MDSPYAPGAGVAPPLLVGRDQARGRAAELFARTVNFGSPGRSPLVLTGVRGVGKTVLLRSMAEEAAAQGFLVAAVTVDRRGPLAVRIATAIAGAMEPLKPAPSTRWRRWVSSLGQLSVEVSVPGVKIERPPRAAGDPAAADRDATVALVAESARLARLDRPGLVIAFDEVQEGPDSDLGVLNAIAQELVAEPLVVLGAGLPQTPDRLMQAGSYAERFNYHVLGPLAPPEAAAALLVPASARQVGWDQDAAEHVLTAANGAPFLLQLYGDAAWRAASPGPGGRIGFTAAQAGVATAVRELHDGMFRGRWNRASPVERQYMVAMAQHLGQDGTAGTGQVAAAMGRPLANLSYVRARLLDKGLIQPIGYGRVAFSFPGFETFVLIEAEERP